MSLLLILVSTPSHVRLIPFRQIDGRQR
jgi:hypothetical protein